MSAWSRYLVWLFVLLLILLAIPVLAEETGSVSGVVRGSDGAPVPGVLVTASGPMLPAGRSATTAADGSFSILRLPPGEYTVTETSPPAGYGAGTAVDGTSTAVDPTNCGANKPTTANSAVFTDPPLGEIGVTFKDLGSGETKASIVCANGSDS